MKVIAIIPNPTTNLPMKTNIIHARMDYCADSTIVHITPQLIVVMYLWLERKIFAYLEFHVE